MSLIKVYKVYNTKIHKFVGGRWRYEPIVPLKVYNVCNTVNRYTNLWVDVGVTHLGVLQVYKACNTKVGAFVGGHWCYKLEVKFKLTKFTIQK